MKKSLIVVKSAWKMQLTNMVVIPDVLYALSGLDTDSDDLWGNIADEEKQFVKPQYYFISSDAGAPNLEDFFWFIENIKAARKIDFTMNKEKFTNDNCIVDWLKELSAQLEDLYIVDFDGASEDFHFTIMNKENCERAMDLFKKMTDHIDDYSYASFVITSDFKG